MRVRAHPWHGADVVFVAVCDDDRLDLVAPLGEEADIWKDLLHAEVRHAVCNTCVHDCSTTGCLQLPTRTLET